MTTAERRLRASTMNLNARQADIDLTIDIPPPLRIPQSTHQLFEGFAVFRCIFEPREEVERLAKLPTVKQAPGDGRQIFQTDADVARLFLEDSTALILSQSPPRLRLANGNKCGSRRLRTRKSLLAGDQSVNLGTVGVARVARNTTQNPAASVGVGASDPSRTASRSAAGKPSPMTVASRSIRQVPDAPATKVTRRG